MTARGVVRHVRRAVRRQPGSIFNVQVDEKAKVAIAAAKIARQRLRALGLTTGANYHS